MSPEALAVLGAAGWAPRRNVDVADHVRVLERLGYRVFPPVRAFLQEYADLRLSYPHPRLPSSLTDILIDPTAASGRIYVERVLDYARRVKKDLTVVGEARKGHLTLMMDDAGRVFGGYDRYLALVGVNGADALERLIAGREVAEIGP